MRQSKPDAIPKTGYFLVVTTLIHTPVTYLARIVRVKAAERRDEARASADPRLAETALSMSDLAEWLDLLPLGHDRARELYALSPTYVRRQFLGAETLALLDRYGYEDPADRGSFLARVVEIEAGKAIEAERP
jgi:hypothetical protein